MAMKSESIVLGGGCFWCLEAVYQRVRGVVNVTSGYAGGTTKNPTYWGLHDGSDDHAEVVKVEFDPDQIDLETVLTIFWTLHNPTTLNQQGNDVGAEYRSVLLFNNEAQQKIAEKTKTEIAEKLWPDRVVTEIKQLDVFWPAEAEHQDYFNKHPEQAYCQLIINPKVSKLKQKFAFLLK
jgi:peptide-methionine (S)-S-oxide reductase